MANNSSTLMQSEEKDYTICFCISKQISTTDIEDICKSLQNKLLNEGWSIDDFDLEEE